MVEEGLRLSVVFLWISLLYIYNFSFEIRGFQQMFFLDCSDFVFLFLFFGKMRSFLLICIVWSWKRKPKGFSLFQNLITLFGRKGVSFRVSFEWYLILVVRAIFWERVPWFSEKPEEGFCARSFKKSFKEELFKKPTRTLLVGNFMPGFRFLQKFWSSLFFLDVLWRFLGFSLSDCLFFFFLFREVKGMEVLVPILWLKSIKVQQIPARRTLSGIEVPLAVSGGFPVAQLWSVRTRGTRWWTRGDTWQVTSASTTRSFQASGQWKRRLSQTGRGSSGVWFT